jgi:hypothetical protein
MRSGRFGNYLSNLMVGPRHLFRLLIVELLMAAPFNWKPSEIQRQSR